MLDCIRPQWDTCQCGRQGATSQFMCGPPCHSRSPSWRSRLTKLHRVILSDFDTLLEIYEYIESMTEAPPTSPVVGEEADADDDNSYVPSDGDYRAIIERQIRNRRGQPAFRKRLRKKYGDKCLVTGCEVFQLVEAAHIRPYRGENDNNVENGLLLRADIHSLFDLDLLGIEPDHLCVELSAELARDVEYAMLAGQSLKCDGHARPSHTALKQRYEQFRERQKGK